MAAPSYTEDLTDISLMESGETGAAALNIGESGADIVKTYKEKQAAKKKSSSSGFKGDGT